MDPCKMSSRQDKDMKLAVRNDKTGLWDFSNLAEALPPAPPIPRKASFITFESIPCRAVADILHSFVYVECSMPFELDGFPKKWTEGLGLVIDAENGKVLTSRAIVPHLLCDLAGLVSWAELRPTIIHTAFRSRRDLGASNRQANPSITPHKGAYAKSHRNLVTMSPQRKSTGTT